MSPETLRDVLVVEDDPDLNETLGAYLELEGFGYRHALDGETALRELRRERPSLVLLDLMLPDIDGFEVCRRIRADSALHDLPVVMLTAMNERRLRDEALSLGVLEYMTKPFDPDALIAAVRRGATQR